MFPSCCDVILYLSSCFLRQRISCRCVRLRVKRVILLFLYTRAKAERGIGIAYIHTTELSQKEASKLPSALHRGKKKKKRLQETE